MAYRTVPSAGVYGRRIPAQHIAPPPTKETFRDLLVFEERLKQNAERLQRQRRKYEAFLVTLVLTTLAFAYKSFLAVSMYTYVHYLWVGCFLVCTTTLVLFFATGMYSEKISYAYKFIPQTNRALRSLNMYLNTRRHSLASPFRLFRSPVPGPSPPHSPPPASRSASGGGGGHQLAPIPPSHNPRGELIFSSKVTPAFRDGYERYRTEWERRRATPPPPTASVGYAPGRKSWFAWRNKDQPPIAGSTVRPSISRTPTPEVAPTGPRVRGRDARTGSSSTSASRQSSRRRGGGSIGASPSASRSASPSASSRASTPELLGGGGRRSGSSSGPEADEAASVPESPASEGTADLFFAASSEPPVAQPTATSTAAPKGRLARGDSFSELIALQENSAML